MAYKIDLLKYGARMLSFYCSINHFFVDAKNETKKLLHIFANNRCYCQELKLLGSGTCFPFRIEINILEPSKLLG